MGSLPLMALPWSNHDEVLRLEGNLGSSLSLLYVKEVLARHFVRVLPLIRPVAIHLLRSEHLVVRHAILVVPHF
jgi:hypothetical protein